MGEIPLCRFSDNTSQCVAEDLLCNGVFDCVDGMDESDSACGHRLGV